MLKRIRENEDGFTLIELMVVVLIISILIAIAIPTFLGAREGAQDRAAQSNIRNAHTAAKTLYADGGSWDPGTILADMAAIEPSLSFGAGAPDAASDSNYVQVVVNDAQELTLTARSDTTAVYSINEVAQVVADTNAGGVNPEVAGTHYDVDGGGWFTTADEGW